MVIEQTMCIRPLLGLEMPPSALQLEEDVWIRRLDKWELDRLVEGESLAEIRAAWVEEHSCAAVYREGGRHPGWPAEDPAESVVSCLRLLKPGRIAGAELIDVPLRKRRTLNGVWIHQGLAPKNVVNLEWRYELNRADEGPLCTLWRWYRRAIESRSHWFQEAVFRLGESYERVTDEHRAVDLVIALECCVGKSEREEGRRKGRRIVTLTANGEDEREAIGHSLANLVQLRNQIVHGSYADLGRDKWSSDVIASCLVWGEECARRCLRVAAALASQSIDLKEEIQKGVPVESLRAKADLIGAF